MKSNITSRVFARLVTIIPLFFVVQSICAQNLVKNPSFEDYTACPTEYGSFEKDVIFWYRPTNGSTDYFNLCAGKMSASKNFIGYQNAFEGDAYAGFYMHAPSGYREYISGELVEKLEKGQKYTFSFMVSLAERSQFAINELGILFSHKLVEIDTKRTISSDIIREKRLGTYVGVRNRDSFKDKNEWIKVSGEYIANGTEAFITLGNFRSNTKTNLSSTGKNLKKAAYYYIDMVSVELTDGAFKLDKTYVLEQLFFKVNGHEIIGNGNKELQELVDHLKAHPDLNITIYGHTDNVGAKGHNKKLSKKRAKEVGLFLLENGLSPLRVAWKGFGDSAPLAANKTEEGRKKNRRVEFVISKKSQEVFASGLFEEDQ